MPRPVSLPPVRLSAEEVVQRLLRPVRQDRIPVSQASGQSAQNRDQLSAPVDLTSRASS